MNSKGLIRDDQFEMINSEGLIRNCTKKWNLPSLH